VKPTPCLGILGKLFGHKYVKVVYDLIYRSNYCYRCGRLKNRGEK
jgi:hypothetical protein